MKYFTSLFCSLLIGTNIYAQLNGDGFYRVQNYMSERYVYIIDDKGSINMTTTSADLGAITLWKNFEKAACDPASVIYIKKVGSQYDLQAQGTGVNKIIGYYVSLYDNGDNTYKAYASKSGITKYLCDGEQSSVEDGALRDNGKGRWRDWYILPISQEEGHYFGVKPLYTDSTFHYLSFYASFAFSCDTTKVKAYYVKLVDGVNAVISKYNSDVIPASMPIILQCTSEVVAENKLNPILSSEKIAAENILKGTYFCNPSKLHYNQVAYNPATMRVLGKKADGKVGFITADLKYIPANTAYLVVPEGTSAELNLLPEENYVAGLEQINRNVNPQDDYIYDLLGKKVGKGREAFSGLSSGLYIHNGKKVIVP